MKVFRALLVHITGWQILRVVLGLIVFVAALMKVHELSTVPYLDQIPPRWVMAVFIEFEILFALWLFFVPQRLSQITWFSTLGLFSFFACVTLYKALTGEASCGCFGRVEINPWYTLTFDSVAIGLLLWLRPAGVKGLFSREHWRTMRPMHFLRSKSGTANLFTARMVGIGTIWLLFCFPTAWSMANFVKTDAHNDLSVLGQVFEGSAGKQVVVLEPEKWEGKPCSLLTHINIGDRLSKGEWIVLLFHHSCPDCQNAIPIYESLGDKFSNDKKPRQVALIEMPPFDDLDKDSCVKKGSCIYGRLSGSQEWFVEAPVEMRLTQGIVTHVAGRDEITNRNKVAVK